MMVTIIAENLIRANIILMEIITGVTNLAKIIVTTMIIFFSSALFGSKSDILLFHSSML